jgi:hypothetical protein
MPYLVRHSDLTAAQRLLQVFNRAQGHTLQERFERFRERLNTLSPAEVERRLCWWFVRGGSRPAENRSFLWLSEDTPVEVLSLLCLDRVPTHATGRALRDEALHRLTHDVLDCKVSLLVLCDWLEEYDVAAPSAGLALDATLLRSFLSIPQRWDAACFDVKHNPRQGVLQKAGSPLVL